MPITIQINSGADFEPVSEGVHAAVLADIVDLGVVDTQFGPKHKVQFIWLTDEADNEGRTKYLFKRYTASLHEKASLRKDVKAIFGRDIDGESFDIEQLIGRQNQLVVQHSDDGKGKTYANIIGIMKPVTKLAIPSDFQRKKDRSDGGKKTVKSAGGGARVTAAVLQPVGAAITNEDIPF